MVSRPAAVMSYRTERRMVSNIRIWETRITEPESHHIRDHVKLVSPGCVLSATGTLAYASAPGLWVRVSVSFVIQAL